MEIKWNLKKIPNPEEDRKKEKMKQTNPDRTDRTIIDLIPTISIITSNMDGLKTPNKRHFVRVSEQIEKIR